MSLTMNAATFSGRRSNALPIIFLGGLIAGTLDFTAACVNSWLHGGAGPFVIAQYIASGVLGPSAFAGGAKTAALGVALHYLIATGATTVFYFASRQLQFMVTRPIITGVLYGVVVYLFMNFIVVPLSFVRRGATPPTLSSRAIQMLILVFCIGLPISAIVRWFSKR